MLDGGLSRVPQPVDRRSVRRPDSPRQQPDEQSTSENRRPTAGPEPGRAPSRNNKPKKSANKPRKLLVVALAVLLAVALGWLVWANLFTGVASTIDGGKNQAVLLTNGQTYFGKLQMVDGEFAKLSNVFYVQSEEAAAQADEEAAPATNNNMRLIKRGQEVFGPDDSMMISRDQILYFENIKDDSQVSQLMRDYQASN